MGFAYRTNKCLAQLANQSINTMNEEIFWTSKKYYKQGRQE